MGGSSQTVGFRYYLGAEFGICIGPVDAVTQIEFGDRIGFTGNVTDSALVDIDKPSLFGGDDSEGGVSGIMEVRMGKPDQGASGYVEAKSGHAQPGHRGFLTLLFRGRNSGEITSAGLDSLPFTTAFARGVTTAAYVGRSGFYWASLNPYIKTISTTVTRILKGWSTPVWYPEKAQIGDGMNPAHILYQCLTDTIWGLGRASALIDDAAWRAAADQLFDEGFGLSFIWAAQSQMEEFVMEVCRHIDASLDTDLRTGLYVLKLVRNDYNPDDLPSFDPSNIVSMDQFDRPGWGETVNEVIVTYTNPATNQEEPISVQDLANVQIQGGIVSETHSYAGIRQSALAFRVAERDLRALSTPLARLQFQTNRTAWDVRKGRAIKVSWPPKGVVDLVCRVIDIDYGTLNDGVIGISAIEDIFAIPTSSYGTGQGSTWTNPAGVPESIDNAAVTEIPYFALQQTLSTTQLNALSGLESFPLIFVERPALQNSRFNVYSSPDISFSPAVLLGAGDYVISALLNGGVTRDDTVFGFDTVSEGGIDFFAGGYFWMNGEWIGIDSIDVLTGTMTVKRGVLDSIPIGHFDNSEMWFYCDGVTEYGFNGYGTDVVRNETTYYRETGRSLSAETAFDTAIQQVHVHQASWSAPYPPANVKLEGAYYPASIPGNFTITWAGRNRLQQTVDLVGWTEGHITPEDGVTYTLKVYDDDTNMLLSTVPGLTTRSTGGTYQFPGGGTTTTYRLEFFAVRGNVESIQKFQHTCTATGNTGDPPPLEVPPGALTYTPDPIWIGGAYYTLLGPRVKKSTDNGVTWTFDSPTSLTYLQSFNYRFVYGGGTFLAYKGDKWFARRTAGTVWTLLDSETELGGLGIINTITYDGTNFVLVRNQGKQIWTSPDGVTWTNTTVGDNPVFAMALIAKIVFAGGQYVTAGSKPSGTFPAVSLVTKILTSPDLVTWTPTTVPAEFLAAPYSIYFNAKWFLISKSGAAGDQVPVIYSSTDLVTWAEVDVGQSFLAGTFQANPIVTSGKLSILFDYLGTGPNIVISTTDGSTWATENQAYNTILRGNKDDLSLEENGGPTLFLRVGSPVEFGGKLLTMSGYSDTSPTLVYPAAAPLGTYFGDPNESYIGSIGNSAWDDSGLTMRFIANGLHLAPFIRSGKHYAEFTILGFAVGFPQIGFATCRLVLGPHLHAGRGITVYGNSTVDFSPAPGDVLGFLLDMVAGTAQIRLNDVPLHSLSGIDITEPWTLFEVGIQTLFHANVGQETYIYPQAGYGSWTP